MNEILILLQILLCFTGIALSYRIFGLIGLFVAGAVVTFFANLEVGCCSTMFGMAVSLGNVAFVGGNLVQDAINENEGGEKVAGKVVWIGFFMSIFMMILSQLSIRFIPNEFDSLHKSFSEVFGQFSIVTIVSLIVYIISNKLNVRLYSFFSKLTTKVWLRSQSSTWISQMVDSILFTGGCILLGVFNKSQFLELSITTYLIKIICAVMEIPFLYWIKDIKRRIPLILQRRTQ